MKEDKSIIADYRFTPRKWQAECLAKLKRFTVIAVHRRAGKTTLAIEGLLLLKAIKEPHALFAYIAPQLKQAKLIAWAALKQACRQFQNYKQDGQTYDLCEIRESELTVKFWNGSEIRLFGADNPDSLRGTKLKGCVIDEVAQMPKELWFEIVYPALMDSKGFALFIGTPKGVNLFSELYDKGNDPNFKDEWAAFLYTCYETDALDPQDIEAYKKSVAEEVFKREMLCDFSASANNQLISLNLAREATKAQIDKRQIATMPLYLGVDVGRFGNDPSVLMFRRGIVAEEPIIYKNLDAMTLASAVKKHVLERKPQAVFVDGTGVGGGVVDVLRSFGVQCFDINFTSRSNDPKCINKRTEMWVRMAEWLQHACIPNNAKLIEELAMPVYEVNDDAVKILESKTKIKQRLGRSPDMADALALTFAEELPQETAAEFFIHQTEIAQQVEQCNPYEQFIRDMRERRFNSYRPFAR